EGPPLADRRQDLQLALGRSFHGPPCSTCEHGAWPRVKELVERRGRWRSSKRRDRPLFMGFLPLPYEAATQGAGQSVRLVRTRSLTAGLLPDHLDADLALPRAVELREDDGLEPTEGQLAVVHAHRDVATEQRRPEVRVRVAALAIRHPWIVVTVAVALRHESIDERLEVVDERALKLIDEQRAGRVQRVHQRDTGRDRELLDGVPDQLGDVRDLGAVLGRQR